MCPNRPEVIATSHKGLCAKQNRRVCLGLLGSLYIFRPYCLVTACVQAKLLQLCLTLCVPIDCSPPGSSVHGILQARSCCSVTQLCPTLCDPTDCTRQASLTLTISWGFPKFMSTASVVPSSHLILCRPLLLLPPVPPSTRAFSNESTLHIRWSKYWSFSFNISPTNECPGLMSFRMDCLDLLGVQGTLKSLL